MERIGYALVAFALASIGRDCFVAGDILGGSICTIGFVLSILTIFTKNKEA